MRQRFSSFWVVFFVVSGAFLSGSEGNPTPWSFAPLKKSESLPATKNGGWAKSRLDHFVLAKMEGKGLQPAAPADQRTLVRRLYFDLTGLPPSRQDLDDFDPADIGKTIDRLLDSPQYGERWARYWLDLTRYTDTTASWLKSTAGSWRYRDWVMKALNDDMPYPDFVKRQLATDLMEETGPEDHVALGFLGLSPTYWKELQLPPEIIKTTVADEWEERVDALGQTFLGLTLACARCHDHKSDPVTAEDYYAIAGVFASVKISDRPTMSEDLWLPVKKSREEVAELEKKKVALKKKKPKPEDLDAQLKSFDAQIAKIKESTPHYNMAMANAVEEAALFVKPKAGKDAQGTALDYMPGQARNLPIHERGNPNQTGAEIPRRFLSAFPQKNGKPRSFQMGSGRLELAEAMIEDSEALFARVIVNRIWQQHFGRGLVSTPSDFGQMGDLPTHPELLDDLTSRFIANGWSLKWLHCEILGSATWQQASLAPDSQQNDPENKWYSRMNRRRLDIEAWRDSMLQVSGELDPSLGGVALNLDDVKNVRRTIYGKIHRRDMNKMLLIHDFPDPTAHMGKRDETISPLQMLFAINGPFVHARAEALGRELSKSGSDPTRQINLAYERLFQRKPNARELGPAMAFLQEGTLSQYAHILLASNEFLFVD